MSTELKFHPLADIFPLMEGSFVAQLPANAAFMRVSAGWAGSPQAS